MHKAHSSPSVAQIRLFWAYLRVLARLKDEDLQQYKISAVRTYTQGRTTSLRAITKAELSRFLADYKPLFERRNARTKAMRNRLVYLLMEKGYCSGVWQQAEAEANRALSEALCEAPPKYALRGATSHHICHRTAMEAPGKSALSRIQRRVRRDKAIRTTFAQLYKKGLMTTR